MRMVVGGTPVAGAAVRRLRSAAQPQPAPDDGEEAGAVAADGAQLRRSDRCRAREGRHDSERRAAGGAAAAAGGSGAAAAGVSRSPSPRGRSRRR
jgi:hypothetical protein